MELHAIKRILPLIIGFLWGMGPAAASIVQVDKPKMLSMTIREIKEFHGNYVILLQTPNRKTLLPIWIEMNEAQTIHMRLAHITPQRPMTHDLFEEALTALGAQIKQAEIVELKEGVFIGRLTVIDASGSKHFLDSRPSDLIILAVKRRLLIEVAQHVLKRAGVDAAAPAIWNP